MSPVILNLLTRFCLFQALSPPISAKLGSKPFPRELLGGQWDQTVHLAETDRSPPLPPGAGFLMERRVKGSESDWSSSKATWLKDLSLPVNLTNWDNWPEGWRVSLDKKNRGGFLQLMSSQYPNYLSWSLLRLSFGHQQTLDWGLSLQILFSLFGQKILFHVSSRVCNLEQEFFELRRANVLMTCFNFQFLLLGGKKRFQMSFSVMISSSKGSLSWLFALKI